MSRPHVSIALRVVNFSTSTASPTGAERCHSLTVTSGDATQARFGRVDSLEYVPALGVVRARTGDAIYLYPLAHVESMRPDAE